MDEKILVILKEIQTKIGQMEAKIDNMEMTFKQENKKLKEELRQEFKQENKKLKVELGEYVSNQILHHMFAFEEEYGRKLTIAFEALTSRSNREKIQDDSIANLNRISDLHTAYVYRHEDQINKLERIKA